jgi:hypothetical protein
MSIVAFKSLLEHYLPVIAPYNDLDAMIPVRKVTAIVCEGVIRKKMEGETGKRKIGIVRYRNSIV